MHLGNAQRGIVNAGSSAPQWPNNVVPYILEGAFTAADRAIIAAVSFDNVVPYILEGAFTAADRAIIAAVIIENVVPYII